MAQIAAGNCYVNVLKRSRLCLFIIIFTLFCTVRSDIRSYANDDRIDDAIKEACTRTWAVVENTRIVLELLDLVCPVFWPQPLERRSDARRADENHLLQVVDAELQSLPPH